MSKTLVDSQTGEVLNEVQLVDKIAELKRQRQDIGHQIKDLEAQMLGFMDELQASKRTIGDYKVTITTITKREFDDSIHQLVPLIGADRFIQAVKVTPMWRDIRELLKEGGEVRKIIEGALTEKISQSLKIEGV